MKLLTVILLFVSSLAFCQDKTGFCGGAMWMDCGRSTQYIGKTRTCAGFPTYDIRTIFSQSDTTLIYNTDTKHSFIDTVGATGSRIIPANTLKDGDIIYIFSSNAFTTSGNPTNNILVMFGNDTIINNTATLGSSHTGTTAEIKVHCKIVKRASNYYMIGIGYTTLVGGAQRALLTDADGVGVLIDITVDNKIDYFYTWGAASTGNKLVSIINVIQLIN